MDTLVELLEESAKGHGSDPALLIKPTFRYRVWTYADLWEGSGRVASYLQGMGVQKGDRVLLWGPNTPQWVLAFFGTLRAGAIAVPLDVRSAPDFVTRVLERTGPRLAFASRFTPHSINGDIASVHLEELDQAVAAYSPHPAEVAVEPNDVAEIMFTSGTTGEPKRGNPDPPEHRLQRPGFGAGFSRRSLRPPPVASPSESYVRADRRSACPTYVWLPHRIPNQPPTLLDL